MRNLPLLYKNVVNYASKLSVKCNRCEETFYSPFDKVFISWYGCCYDCAPEGEDRNEASEDVLKALELSM